MTSFVILTETFPTVTTWFVELKIKSIRTKAQWCKMNSRFCASSERHANIQVWYKKVFVSQNCQRFQRWIFWIKGFYFRNAFLRFVTHFLQLSVFSVRVEPSTLSAVRVRLTVKCSVLLNKLPIVPQSGLCVWTSRFLLHERNFARFTLQNDAIINNVIIDMVLILSCWAVILKTANSVHSHWERVWLTAGDANGSISQNPLLLCNICHILFIEDKWNTDIIIMINNWI